MPKPFHVIATPDEKDVDDIISSVKSVTVLRETDTQRTMLVQLNNEKLADLIASYGKNNPPDKGTADDAEMHNTFMACLEQGMRRANVWYTWTVDKSTWQTITMSYNLSSLLQETARVGLERHPEMPQDVAALLETIAYYSDLKTYTTFLNAKAVQKLDLPEEAKEAIAVDDLVGSDPKPIEAKAK